MCKLKRSTCAWEGIEALERDLLQPDYEWQLETLFHHFLLSTSPLEQRRTVEKAVKRQIAHQRIFPTGRSHKVEGRKIRVGFFSYDFCDHPMSVLITSTFENFDRSKFELFGFSIGPADGSEYRDRIRQTMDHFYDMQQMIDTEIAANIKKCGIDILFDLCGYTFGNRWGVVARRPAPIQIGWLVWPGTMGADFIDYMIADPIVAPRQAGF